MPFSGDLPDPGIEPAPLTFLHGRQALHHECHHHVLSCVQPFVTPWTAACQAPLSMEFSRQEYWSGLPFPSPGDLTNPGTELPSPVSPTLQVDSLPPSRWGSPWTLNTLVEVSYEDMYPVSLSNSCRDSFSFGVWTYQLCVLWFCILNF